MYSRVVFMNAEERIRQVFDALTLLCDRLPPHIRLERTPHTLGTTIRLVYAPPDGTPPVCSVVIGVQRNVVVMAGQSPFAVEVLVTNDMVVHVCDSIDDVASLLLKSVDLKVGVPLSARRR